MARSIFDYAVPAVIGVACDYIVLGLALVENKLVQKQLLCVWWCFGEDTFLGVRHGEGWCGPWCKWAGERQPVALAVIVVWTCKR